MPRSETIRIGDRVYGINPEVNRYQIDVNDLAELRMGEIPCHSHLEVTGMLMPRTGIECEMWIVNGGGAGSDEFLSVYGGASLCVTQESAASGVGRLRRAFPDLYPFGDGRNPAFRVGDSAESGLIARVYLGLNFQGRSETTVRAAIDPFIYGFRRLCAPDAHVFICHASEDKPVVRELARFIARHGPAVWLDEQEMRAGDSIVERISDGLERASHVVVVLSIHSASKPWVTKELSSALTRQLDQRPVVVLPLRLDDSSVPILLADIKYADGRSDIESGFKDVLAAIFDRDPYTRGLLGPGPP